MNDCPPVAMPVMGAERSARRDGLHTAALMAPWALVVYLWQHVLAETGPAALGDPLVFVTVSLVITPAITAMWIAHNLAIHRAKGPRTGLPDVAVSYDRDWTGRPVFADWGTVRTAPVVFVAGVERQKTFVPSRGQREDIRGARDASAHGVPVGTR